MNANEGVKESAILLDMGLCEDVVRKALTFLLTLTFRIALTLTLSMNSRITDCGVRIMDIWIPSED